MAGRDAIFHVFRNTPFGRETFLQALEFSRKLDLELRVYIPASRKLLLYLQRVALQIELTGAYLRSPHTARDHVYQLLEEDDESRIFFYEPREYSASNLPDIPADFQFMSCPRNISDLSSRISLGHIGSKVRQILSHASFPVLIPSPVHKPWNSITVMFGGSVNGIKCLQLGISISRISGLPLYIFTQAEGRKQKDYREILEQRGLLGEMENTVQHWGFFDSGSLEENLYYVAHDSLIIAGTHGSKGFRGLFFGKTMEKLQSTMPNNLLLVSRQFRSHPWYNPYSSRHRS